MVGVAGKFKGCNTCRSRRVKCDNRRPECQKCMDTGRKCGGYERQRVFIVGTTKDRGRCSSHPHRSLLTARQKNKRPLPKNTAPSPVRIEHEFGDPLVSISNSPSQSIHCIALHTQLSTLIPNFVADGQSFTLPSLMHCLPDASRSSPALEFSMQASCLVHVQQPSDVEEMKNASSSPRDKGKGKQVVADTDSQTTTSSGATSPSTFLFLYESRLVPFSRDNERNLRIHASQKQLPPWPAESGDWKALFGGSSSVVKSRGPVSYRSFPGHYFFTRLYRPNACFDAILRRRSTFLADPEWTSVPWEDIPKGDMDRLFDILVLLPGIFERAERLETIAPSKGRRLKGRDLLSNCMRIDKMFDDWYQELHSRSEAPLFWTAKPDPFVGADPEKWQRYHVDGLFASEFRFVNMKIAFLHLYYWSALCIFYRTIQQINRVCVEPTSALPVAAPQHHYQPTAPAMHPSLVHSFSTAPLQAYMPAPSPAYVIGQPHFMQPSHVPFTSVGVGESYNVTTSEPFTPSPQPIYPYDQTYLFSTASPQSLSPEPYQELPYQPFLLPATPPIANTQHMTTPSTSRTATPTPPPAANSEPPVDPRFSDIFILTLANSICQSLPYALSTALESYGPDQSVWPLWNALQVYSRSVTQGGGYDVEANWCEVLLENLKAEGWAFAGQMGQFEWRPYNFTNNV